MYTVVNGFDLTGYDTTRPNVPHDSIRFSQSINDPLPQCTFDIEDPQRNGSFSIGQEVVIWNENAPALGTTPTVPSQSFASNTTDYNGSRWSHFGSPTISGNSLTCTFSNAANGTFIGINQIIAQGYVKVGQTYMLSAYLTISSSLTGCEGQLAFQFQDENKNALSPTYRATYTSVTGGQIRVNITGVAPANAVYVVIQFGGIATSSTNSGTIHWGASQFEPMWFVNEGVTYPTPDLNAAQGTCAILPDTSISRACRIFAGTINDIDIEYVGRTRIWHISCVGPGAVLENSLVSATVTNNTDVSAIQSIITSYFMPIFPGYAIVGTSPPSGYNLSSTLITGVTFTGQFADVSFREVLNSLIELSGYQYYFDWYYTLWYVPLYYQVATFALSDSPDNANSFAYYDYHYKIDGTQLKANVKVTGSSSSVVSQVTGQYTPLFQQPPYVSPPYSSLVSDGSLTSTTATTGRGLAELTKYNAPRTFITCKSAQYAPAGYLVYFTSSLDSINNEAFLIQKVTGRCLGGGINEFEYEIGAYNPTLLDHMRNLTKVVSNPTQTTTTTPTANELNVTETIFYTESPIAFH